MWDWRTGDNVVLRISDALDRARRVLALWSPAYFERERFTTDEWTALMAQRPDDTGRRRLVPIRVAEVTPPAVLASLLYRDVFGLDEERAKTELLAAVRGPTALLRTRLSSLAEDGADRLADRLGDLPLALAQAAQTVGEMGLTVPDYLDLLDKQTVEILSEGTPAGYPVPLAAVVRTAMERLTEEDPAAAQLLQLCAFLGPEPTDRPVHRPGFGQQSCLDAASRRPDLRGSAAGEVDSTAHPAGGLSSGGCLC